jgi:hypothetical protein
MGQEKEGEPGIGSMRGLIAPHRRRDLVFSAHHEDLKVERSRVEAVSSRRRPAWKETANAQYMYVRVFQDNLCYMFAARVTLPPGVRQVTAGGDRQPSGRVVVEKLVRDRLAHPFPAAVPEALPHDTAVFTGAETDGPA